MVKLNQDKLLEYLEDNKIDVIAVAISSWHALGIDAFIYDISKKYQRKVKVLILIIPHQRDGYIISEKDFQYRDSADIKFEFIDIPPDNQNFIKERVPNFISKYTTMFSGIRNIQAHDGINDLFLLSPHLTYNELLIYFNNKKISSKYKPIFVLIDEGYASYISKEHWNILRSEVSNEEDYSLLDNISSKIFRSADYMIRKMIVRSIKVEPRFILNVESQLTMNKDVCDTYKQVLKLRDNKLKMDDLGKTVLIITQPFSEMGSIPLETELNLMQSLIKFINKYDIKPILKPHPREKSDKYDDLVDCDFEIIKNKFPVEEIIPNLDPVCVVGYTSTALLNSKIFFDINAVSLLDVMISNFNEKTDEASDDEFKNLTGKYVNFVDKIEDIEEYITD